VLKINPCIWLLLLSTFIKAPKLKAQVTESEIAIYNVGLGSIASGIGALINKKPKEKWHKVLLKGMGQGALGGFVVYQSKNLIKQISIKEDFSYSWYAKVVNSAGLSIIENASSNRNFWEVWHMNIGFNRIELHTKESLEVKYRIMPVSFAYTVAGFAQTDFEFKRSLQTGEFIFSTNDSRYREGAAVFANVAVFTKNSFDDYYLYSHELIHIYQYYDYNFVNSYFIDPSRQIASESKLFSKMKRIFYLDLQGAVLRPLYLVENINQDCYFDNFYENEAEYFTNRRVNCR